MNNEDDPNRLHWTTTMPERVIPPARPIRGDTGQAVVSRVGQTAVIPYPPLQAPRPIFSSSETMVIKIGSASGSGWTWTEQQATSGGSWTDKSGGRTNSTDGLAYAFNNWVDITSGTYVLATRYALAGGGSEWRFMAPLPKPVTQYKEICVNGSAQWAENWTKAHG